MITQNDIIAALRERIEKVFPDDVCYTEMAPKNFTRPSTLIEIDEISMEQLNYSMINVKAVIRITCFAEVDVYHNSQFAVLSERQTKVFATLLGGGFPVGERSVRVTNVHGSGGYDYSEALATFDWEEAAEEFMDIATSPLMETYDMRLGAELGG